MKPRELDELLKKVKGRYRLVTLFQKRMRELKRDMPVLVELAEGEKPSLEEIVRQEVSRGKVELVTGPEADKMRAELAMHDLEDLPPVLAPPSVEGGEKTP